MRILLLFPNTSNEGVMPLAIGILSAIAKKLGCEAAYFETSFYRKPSSSLEDRERFGEFKSCDRDSAIKLLPHEQMRSDLERKINEFKPQILAVSANSLEYELFCDLLEKLDWGDCRPFIILGGVHATVAPEEVIANRHVDAICVGEGEGAWEEFLVKFKDGVDISDIKNLWVKKGSSICRNPLRPLLSEDKLWATPVDESFFDKRHYLRPFDGEIYHRGNIELSRGCPYSCTYCVNAGVKVIYRDLGKFVRMRPFENLQEAIRQEARLGSEMLQCQDECLMVIPYAALQRFCDWYGREIKIPLLVQSRPETITEEKVKLLAGMNIPVQVSCGVESGSERILHKICKRRMTLEQIRNAYQLLRKYGLRSTAYTMIGFPTETRAEVFETIRLIRELDVDISIMSVFFPFKGSPLRDFCIQQGFITGEEKTKTFTDRSVLRNQPMNSDEIYNLRRVYSLYARLPEEYFQKIALCEREPQKNEALFGELRDLLYNSYYRTWKLK